MTRKHLVIDLCWSIGLALWCFFFLIGVGFLGIATSLGCQVECRRGEDWAWLGLALSWAVGTLITALLIVLGWCLRRWRRHFLIAATVVVAAACLIGVGAYVFLDDGRGNEQARRATILRVSVGESTSRV